VTIGVPCSLSHGATSYTPRSQHWHLRLNQTIGSPSPAVVSCTPAASTGTHTPLHHPSLCPPVSTFTRLILKHLPAVTMADGPCTRSYPPTAAWATCRQRSKSRHCHPASVRWAFRRFTCTPPHSTLYAPPYSTLYAPPIAHYTPSPQHSTRPPHSTLHAPPIALHTQ
jgi:hypothetical protein